MHAPSAGQFQAVLDELKKGTSPNAVKIDRMSGRKVYKMIFCLAEALYSQDRDFARQAIVGSIRRDESAGRLLLYFSFATADLRSRSGVLGIRSKFGTGATAITNATADLFARFATPLFKIQDFRPSKAPSEAMDENLLVHTRTVQVQTIIDAAADEQLSVRQMQQQVLPNSNNQLMFPNLKLVTLDHCHATSRILKRGFGAVPALHDIMREDIRAKGSISQMIQHSKPFRQFFFQHGQKSEGPTSTMQSLSAAKHRYESLRTPLIRSVLRFDSLMATAAWIYHHRRGKAEAKRAELFLRRQSTERILLRAMMADAAEETMNLLRFADQKRLEVASLPREIAAWTKRTTQGFEVLRAFSHGS